jgi:hypothetical protein
MSMIKFNKLIKKYSSDFITANTLFRYKESREFKFLFDT